MQTWYLWNYWEFDHTAATFEMESLSVFPLGVVTVLKTSASEIPLGEDQVVNIRNTEP